MNSERGDYLTQMKERAKKKVRCFRYAFYIELFALLFLLMLQAHFLQD